MTDNNKENNPLHALNNDSVLIIDDEPSLLESLGYLLSEAKYKTILASDGEQGIQELKKEQPDIVLVDLKLPDLNGIEFTRKARELGSVATIVLMSAYGSSANALEAIKAGASDFIAKPFRSEDLLLTLRKASERKKLHKENEILREQVTRRYSFSNIIAKSACMLEVFEIIKKISAYHTTVLIQGESGTGKELVARAIHYNSPRRNRRFVAINCGAIPENLLESELFGHKKGAFTDATKDKKGLFEEAHGGTILLDEIGELPTHLQVKLLRVLQERAIRPVGDSKTIPVDVRVLAASLRDLEADVTEGRFRDDLFYRLNVISLRIPPLKERKEDMPLLINHFIKRNQEKLGLPVYGLEKDAMEIVLNYSWPGNIRELENCIERAMILTEGNSITKDSLPPAIKRPSEPSNIGLLTDDLSIKNQTRKLEEELIKKALKQTDGNRTHAVKLLDISHRTLLYKIKEYGLADDDK